MVIRFISCCWDKRVLGSWGFSTNEVGYRDVPTGKGYAYIGFCLLLSRFLVTGFWDLWYGGLGIGVSMRKVVRVLMYDFVCIGIWAICGMYGCMADAV